MNIRGLMDRDLEQLKEIHDRFYKDEFPFPEFFNNYLMCFVVEDDKGKIITGGGVRTITEAILITDKSVEIKARQEALIKAMHVSIFTSDRNKFNQLHAFVSGDNWIRHLKKAGFVEAKGTSLVYNI